MTSESTQRGWCSRAPSSACARVDCRAIVGGGVCPPVRRECASVSERGKPCWPFSRTRHSVPHNTCTISRRQPRKPPPARTACPAPSPGGRSRRQDIPWAAACIRTRTASQPARNFLGLRPAYARAPRVSRRATASATTRHGALLTASGGRGRARHLGISSGRGHSICEPSTA